MHASDPQSDTEEHQVKDKVMGPEWRASSEHKIAKKIQPEIVFQKGMTLQVQPELIT